MSDEKKIDVSATLKASVADTTKKLIALLTKTGLSKLTEAFKYQGYDASLIDAKVQGILKLGGEDALMGLLHLFLFYTMNNPSIAGDKLNNLSDDAKVAMNKAIRLYEVTDKKPTKRDQISLSRLVATYPEVACRIRIDADTGPMAGVYLQVPAGSSSSVFTTTTYLNIEHSLFCSSEGPYLFTAEKKHYYQGWLVWARTYHDLVNKKKIVKPDFNESINLAKLNSTLCPINARAEFTKHFEGYLGTNLTIFDKYCRSL